MISACMIDGFGWFHEADYRRSWLFFDDVEYVLPVELRGPLAYPSNLESSPDFRLARKELADDTVAALAERAHRDAEDVAFQELSASVPKTDAEYAQLVVWSDPQARAHLGDAPLEQSPLALAYLLNKLDWVARRDGAIPIVGQPYASDLLAWKASHAPKQLPWKSSPNRDSYAAFAAGLTLDFLSDDELTAANIEDLVRFKASNGELLADSQRSLLETAERFASLPDDPSFAVALAALRADTRKQRQELDAKARELWLDAGLEIAKRAVAAGGAAFAGGMLLSSFSTGLVATGVTAGAVVASELIKPVARQPKAPATIAYLFRVGQLGSAAARRG